jgi:hypothetical protein
MEIRIVVAVDGSVQAHWPDDRPLLTLALLRQVHDELLNQFAAKEAQAAGPRVLVARQAVNGMLGAGGR